MSHSPLPQGSGRLLLIIKSAYWVGLLIIAAIAMASYILLQQMMAAQQREEALMSLVSAQKTLSQRVVFLANAAPAAPGRQKPALVKALTEATDQFDHNYGLLLRRIGSAEGGRNEFDPRTVESVLFGAPHHLDYFTQGLVANGRRLVSAIETDMRLDGPANGYLAGRERAELDDTIAMATLNGYTALEKLIAGASKFRMDNLLSTHRTLFYVTMTVIVLVALFIFKPMSDAILRRTHELIDARNSMAFIAAHDGLTGLHNRVFLTDHFDTLITAAQRRGQRLAVVQIDLDRFKQINDTLGHTAGDYVLVVTAQRLRDCSRPGDLCIRLGGDEFIMIIADCGSDEEIEAAARRTLSRIAEPIGFHGSTIVSNASAGIAVFPADASNASDLCVHADLALYAAKRAGTGAISFFTEELRQELEHRKQMEKDLRVAIASRSFEVHYQPQVRLGDGKIAGVEALVRWNHPLRGPIMPGEFIPIAEKSGLMSDVGRIIVTKAIEEVASWHRAGIPFGRVSVNVSGLELREPDFDHFLFDTLRSAGLPADKLSLEIVESVILDDEKTGIASKLRTIRAAGVHLELDDFGTGYASLSHVSPNEIDRLKIDRRFVQNIDSNSENCKIVRAVTDLARSLGISIIAEGAETTAEIETLREIGCEQVQGYSIAAPMAGAQARDWLVKRASGRRQLALVASASV